MFLLISIPLDMAAKPLYQALLWRSRLTLSLLYVAVLTLMAYAIKGRELAIYAGSRYL